MNPKLLLRPSLTIILGFIGALVARGGTPPAIFAVTGDYFLIVAALAFGTLGFILPDILELAGKAGIAALAKQIVSYSPRSSMRFPLKRSGKSDSKPVNPMVVDTSALIDGRLVDIAKTGFIYGTLMIIPSVIRELHRLADSADELKRVRGRRGLENLAALQNDKQTKVTVVASDPKEKTVDEMLVRLAQDLRGKIITVDYNLNKMAKVKRVATLNVNELANAVKTAVLPGERLKIQVNSTGREKDQGVGYLEDGTMVVIEGGAGLRGQAIDVKVLRILQTAAGKMIFSRPMRT